MKRAERILGISGVSLLILGEFFKYNHWPGAGVMITLGVALFNFGYLPFQLSLQWREARTGLQKFYLIFRFVTFFIILTGFIFKVQHWPGAGLGLILGSIMLPSYLILYFVLRARGQGKLPFILHDLLIAITAYGIYYLITTTLVSPGAAEGYRLLEHQYLRLNAGFSSANQIILESMVAAGGTGEKELDRSIEELENLGMDCVNTLDSIKSGFYRLLLGNYYKERSGHLRLSPAQLADAGIAFRYFVENGNGDRVKSAIDHYRAGIEEIARQHHLSSGAIGLGLQTGNIVGRFGRKPWISYIFEAVPTGSVIINLSLLKQMVLLTENNMLNGLLSQMELSEEARILQELAARESEKAIELKENEIVRVRQQQELQALLLEQSEDEIKQNRMMAIFGLGGAGIMVLMFSVSTRAYFRKQRDNKILEAQKKEISEKNEELNQQNEEIASQRDEIEAQRDTVFSQKEELEKVHNEISASIDYATRLQDSILPQEDLLQEHFEDHFILFRPKHKVSGDFYWWTRSDGCVIVAAADCTGHGVPGAFMSMLGISLLQEIVNKEGITQPGIILDHLRQEVIRSLNQKGTHGEQKDGLDIALVSIDTRTLTCEYAGANNPVYLVHDGKLKVCKPDTMPISFYERMDPFETRTMQLTRNDQIYLFSDGFADQFGGSNRKKFKYTAFRRLLLDHSTESMEVQKKVLFDTIVQWQGAHEQTDDMVIVGIRI